MSRIALIALVVFATILTLHSTKPVDHDGNVTESEITFETPVLITSDSAVSFDADSGITEITFFDAAFISG
jgi:hypothetical protein